MFHPRKHGLRYGWDTYGYPRRDASLWLAPLGLEDGLYSVAKGHDFARRFGRTAGVDVKRSSRDAAADIVVGVNRSFASARDSGSRARLALQEKADLFEN